MRFFHIDPVTNEVQPTPEILMVNPFNVIWDRSDKEYALKELAFIVFCEDRSKTNPYRDLEEKDVIVEVFDGQEYTPDEVVQYARQKIRDIHESSKYYKSMAAAQKGLETLRTYLEKVDLDERTNSGGMVHDPNKVSKAIQDMPANMESLSKMENMVASENFVTTKTTKDRKQSMFED